MRAINIIEIHGLAGTPGQSNLFTQTLRYLVDESTCNFHTPDDVELKFACHGKCDSSGILVNLRFWSSITHVQNLIKLHYRNELVMTEYFKSDILKILSHYGLSIMYSKNHVSIEARHI